MEQQKTYSVPVNENGRTLINELIDAKNQTLVGILVKSNRDDLVVRRGTIKLSIGGIDICEDGEPAYLYMKPLSHYLGYKAIGELSLKTTDRRLRVSYVDSPSSDTVFAPHVLNVTLFFRNDQPVNV